MVTSEGQTDDESAVVSREKNMVTLRFETGAVSDFNIDMKWRFIRGSEIKKMTQKLHIKI
jgi:hypothetical protein